MSNEVTEAQEALEELLAGAAGKKGSTKGTTHRSSTSTEPPDESPSDSEDTDTHDTGDAGEETEMPTDELDMDKFLVAVKTAVKEEVKPLKARLSALEDDGSDKSASKDGSKKSASKKKSKSAVPAGMSLDEALFQTAETLVGAGEAMASLIKEKNGRREIVARAAKMVGEGGFKLDDDDDAKSGKEDDVIEGKETTAPPGMKVFSDAELVDYAEKNGGDLPSEAFVTPEQHKRIKEPLARLNSPKDEPRTWFGRRKRPQGEKK